MENRNKKEESKYKTMEVLKKQNQYSLCIPVYNEGNRILKELEKAQKAKVNEIADIILLDGGSTDGSISIENLKKFNVNTLITMKEKGIYKQSEALKAGFEFSIKRKYKGVITIDGNNKDGIEDVKKFIEKLQEGYDYIQGSRFLKGGKSENTPIIRYLAIKYIHAPLIRLTSHKKYTDTTNLFRGYSIKYLTDGRVQIFREIFRSYELSVYLSTRADKINLKTCEIPVKRCYPSRKKYSTKVGKIKGNFLLIKSLLENLIGKYNPK